MLHDHLVRPSTTIPYINSHQSFSHLPLSHQAHHHQPLSHSHSHFHTGSLVALPTYLNPNPSSTPALSQLPLASPLPSERLRRDPSFSRVSDAAGRLWSTTTPGGSKKDSLLPRYAAEGAGRAAPPGMVLALPATAGMRGAERGTGSSVKFWTQSWAVRSLVVFVAVYLILYIYLRIVFSDSAALIKS